MKKVISYRQKIIELAKIIKEVVVYEGEVNFDKTKPDGSPRKFLDSTHINNIGFTPKTNLKEGLIKTYRNYIKGKC